MSSFSIMAAAVIVVALLSPGCSRPPAAPEPDRVVVQHLLVSFAGKLPGKPIKRTQAEAKKLAADLYERARNGEDFDALVKQYTDDQHPGIYTMVNNGRTPAEGEYGRDQMVQGFGDVSFGLAVGAVGMCGFDAAKSPFGWHIIKRVE